MISPARSLPIIPSASHLVRATPAESEQPVSAPSAPRSAVVWRGPVPNAPADPTVTALRRAGGPRVRLLLRQWAHLSTNQPPDHPGLAPIGGQVRMSHHGIRSSERQCRREQPRDRSNGARSLGNHGERRRSIFGALHGAHRSWGRTIRRRDRDAYSWPFGALRGGMPLRLHDTGLRDP